MLGKIVSEGKLAARTSQAAGKRVPPVTAGEGRKSVDRMLKNHRKEATS